MVHIARLAGGRKKCLIILQRVNWSLQVYYYKAWMRTVPHLRYPSTTLIYGRWKRWKVFHVRLTEQRVSENPLRQIYLRSKVGFLSVGRQGSRATARWSGLRPTRPRGPRHLRIYSSSGCRSTVCWIKWRWNETFSLFLNNTLSKQRLLMVLANRNEFDEIKWLEWNHWEEVFYTG